MPNLLISSSTSKTIKNPLRHKELKITRCVGLSVALAAGLEEQQAACDEIGFYPCGSAAITPAFGLDARIIVHAVGPVWRGSEYDETDCLRSAYDIALECVASEGARSKDNSGCSAGSKIITGTQKAD